MTRCLNTQAAAKTRLTITGDHKSGGVGSDEIVAQSHGLPLRAAATKNVSLRRERMGKTEGARVRRRTRTFGCNQARRIRNQQLTKSRTPSPRNTAAKLPSNTATRSPYRRAE